ncbi:MAG: serine/threonine-protein kinase, partial [Myxococcota bacterium]
MARVHLARLIGDEGFSRTVALKRLHPTYATDPEFSSMFLDEAKLAARIQHPNVISILDLVLDGDELCIVMEYVRGATLRQLVMLAQEQGVALPPAVIGAIMSDVLSGLHAAHNATSDHGEPLDIVHRDVSPQNILVGVDGVARVLDFGI